jgi:predicted metal-dependent enzyme (double-stranded beta helix superfamily)
MREAVPELLIDKQIFAKILTGVLNGTGYPDLGQATMFDNELFLYAAKNRMFTIRLYLWAPGEYTPVHDHNAWGIIGPVSGDFEVIRYTRQDNGEDETHARLVENRRLLLLPGQVEVTMPLNRGLHRTGNPTDITSATIHLYGNPVRRTYINTFDLESGTVSRLYSPKAKKRKLAQDALRGLGFES